MSQSRTYDFIVVGKGILGLTLASRLLQEDPGLSIGIVSPQNSRGTASRAAGAMLGCFGEVTGATFKSPYEAQKFAISYAAKNQWHQISAKLSELDPENRFSLHEDRGTFLILNTISGDLDRENFDETIRAMEQYQEPYEVLKTSDIPRRIEGYDPISSHRADLALYIPGERFINPHSVLELTEKKLRTYSRVEFLDDTVQKLLTKKTRMWGVETRENGTLNSENIVLATGAFTQPLIDSLPALKGKIPKVLSGFGYAFSIKNNTGIKEVIRTNNRAGACGLHVVPRQDNTLYIGASNNVRNIPAFHETVDIATFVQRCAMDQINKKFSSAEIIETHVGNRPVTMDTFPLLGETKSIKGLYFMTGTYRDGFYQSPVLSDFLAEQIFSGAPILENIFEPERQPIQIHTKDELIAEAIKHTASATYEREMRLPTSNWGQICEKMYASFFDELYDKIVYKYKFASIDLLLSIFDREHI